MRHTSANLLPHHQFSFLITGQDTYSYLNKHLKCLVCKRSTPGLNTGLCCPLMIEELALGAIA
jgi:hypothetical protein